MKILLGVCGSIAAYKAYEIARLLVKNKHQVRVVLTSGAEKFILPETFRYLGIEKVYRSVDDFNPELLSNSENVLHIELEKWADQVVIAPTTLNTLARINNSFCDDLLTSVVQARRIKPILIFPAMNTQMWLQERTQNLIKHLRDSKNIRVFNPDTGELACQDVGEGKLLDPKTISHLIEASHHLELKSKSILITAGATVSVIDDVRYLTNPSSGKTGLALAKVFLGQGYQVTVLGGQYTDSLMDHLKHHPQFKFESTITAQRMYEKMKHYFPNSSLFISTAAVCDFEFPKVHGKIKKSSFTDHFKITTGKDILHEALKMKTNQKVIGFAAETELTDNIIKEKLNRKPVDLLVANQVHHGIESETKGFNTEENTYSFFTIDAKELNTSQLSKNELAHRLLSWFQTGEI